MDVTLAFEAPLVSMPLRKPGQECLEQGGWLVGCEIDINHSYKWYWRQQTPWEDVGAVKPKFRPDLGFVSFSGMISLVLPNHANQPCHI